MSRTARLLELLLQIQTRSTFTAQALADEFGVSRRTMLRDLLALSEMGIALDATPGPGGGYSLPWGRRRLSMSFTLDEALALVIAYEALLRYSASPFAESNLSAATKLRAAMPVDAVTELDRVRRHIAVREPVYGIGAPALATILTAAVNGTYLRVVYDSATSGLSTRVVFPCGVYAAHGFWYCACTDDQHADQPLILRADRIQSATPIDEMERGVPMSIDDWFQTRDIGTQPCEVRFHALSKGLKQFDLQPLVDRAVRCDKRGQGYVWEAVIDTNDIDYWAGRFLAAGSDVRVESPPALVVAIRRRLSALCRRYE